MLRLLTPVEADGFQWMSEDGFKRRGASVVTMVIAVEEEWSGGSETCRCREVDSLGTHVIGVVNELCVIARVRRCG